MDDDVSGGSDVSEGWEGASEDVEITDDDDAVARNAEAVDAPFEPLKKLEKDIEALSLAWITLQEKEKRKLERTPNGVPQPIYFC